MTEKQIGTIKDKLYMNGKGEFRKLFYKRNGLPKQGLLSNDGIMERLGIDTIDMNSLELIGVKRILGTSLAQARKQAKDAKLAWIDWEMSKTMSVEKGGNRYDTTVTIAKHGFLNDIEKINDNIDKFETISDQHIAIAELTKDVGDVKIALLEEEERIKLKNNKQAKKLKK